MTQLERATRDALVAAKTLLSEHGSRYGSPEAKQVAQYIEDVLKRLNRAGK